MSIGRNHNQPSWTFRRRVITMALLFCAGTVIYIMLKGEDTRIFETIVLGSYGLAVSVIGSAIFGAIWDDKNIKYKNVAPARARAQPPADLPPVYQPKINMTALSTEDRTAIAKDRLAQMQEKKMSVDAPYD